MNYLLIGLEVIFWTLFIPLILLLIYQGWIHLSIYLEDKYYDALFIRRGRPDLAGNWDKEDDN